MVFKWKPSTRQASSSAVIAPQAFVSCGAPGMSFDRSLIGAVMVY